MDFRYDAKELGATMTSVAFDALVRPVREIAGFSPHARSWIKSGGTRVGMTSERKIVKREGQARHVSPSVGDFAVHNEGFEYAVSRLTDLLRKDAIQPQAALRFIRVLHRVQLPDFVFPRISADEDGEVIGLWTAGRMSLELSIPTEGDAYLRMTEDDGREVVVDFFKWLPNAEITKFLGKITRVVVLSNPRWRTHFVS